MNNIFLNFSTLQKNKIAFWAMTIGMFFNLISVQNVGAAYRHIQGGLGAGPDEISWVLTSFLIAEVIMLPLSGWLTRTMSTRMFFFMCSMGFTAASILCGFAWSVDSMIFFRIIQGFFGGGMMPAMFSTMFTLYPQNKQQIIAILVGVIATLAAALGPHMGGWISEEFGWRFIFIINAPFSFILGVIVLRFSNFTEKEYLWNKIDFIGIGLLACFLGSALAILEEGRRADWFESNLICILSIICLLSFIFFIFRELKTKFPVVDLSIFLERNFLICSILVFIWGIVIFSSQYLLPVLIARVREFDSITIASMTYIMGAAQVLSGFLALILFIFLKKRIVCFIGFIMLALGTWMQGWMISEIGLQEIILPQFIRGLSAQLCFLPMVLLAMGHLKKDKLKNASGLYSLMNRLGAGIGIATTNSFLENKITEQYLYLGNLVDQRMENTSIFLNKLHNIIPKHLETSPESIRLSNQIIYSIGIQESTIIAFNQIMLIMAVIALCIAPLALLLKGIQK
ncbi:MAG: Multidrug export protein EmrB [Alphaproteobacteria bacterium MarineAlpha9_Bin2]|nr:MAG: Multidrug export protein EmrB [Alphaproteobacteria bacterium MarineAlpha9_Bin2]